MTWKAADVTSATHEALVTLLAERSFKKGNFVLSSGAASTFYVDARKTTMTPQGLQLIGKLGYHAICEASWNVSAVGGLTLGADPVAYAIARESAESPRLIRAFTVRKEAKVHGTGQLIEGPFDAGDQCIIVEDVITTGNSALRAARAVRDAGGVPLGVLAVVDREEGGREHLEHEGLPVHALVRLREVIAR